MKMPNLAPKLFGARKVGDVVTISLDGAFRSAKYLGSGRFTTAYQIDRDSVALYTFFEDFSKSVLVSAKRECPNNPYLPEIQRIGTHRHPRYKWGLVYLTQMYRCGEQHLERHKQVLNVLQEAHEDVAGQFPHDVVRTYECRKFNLALIKAVSKDVPRGLTQALEVLTEVSMDWGDHYLFDNFKPRNFGCTKEGQLIMIDPLFDMEKIRDDWRARRKERMAQGHTS